MTHGEGRTLGHLGVDLTLHSSKAQPFDRRTIKSLRFSFRISSLLMIYSSFLEAFFSLFCSTETRIKTPSFAASLCGRWNLLRMAIWRSVPLSRLGIRQERGMPLVWWHPSVTAQCLGLDWSRAKARFLLKACLGKRRQHLDSIEHNIRLCMIFYALFLFFYFTEN